MPDMWVVNAEFGDGSDFRYEPRFYIEATDEEAQALSRRLNRAATSTFSLAQLPDYRRGPDHEQVIAAARAAMLYMDPDATDNIRYSVQRVRPLVLAEEAPTQNPAEQLFRAIRDLV